MGFIVTHAPNMNSLIVNLIFLQRKARLQRFFALEFRLEKTPFRNPWRFQIVWHH